MKQGPKVLTNRNGAPPLVFVPTGEFTYKIFVLTTGEEYDFMGAIEGVQKAKVNK